MDARTQAVINELNAHVMQLVARCANLAGDLGAAKAELAELKAKLDKPKRG